MFHSLFSQNVNESPSNPISFNFTPSHQPLDVRRRYVRQVGGVLLLLLLRFVLPVVLPPFPRPFDHQKDGDADANANDLKKFNSFWWSSPSPRIPLQKGGITPHPAGFGRSELDHNQSYMQKLFIMDENRIGNISISNYLIGRDIET